MRRALKSIDFYEAVPSELSEGTVSGACISIVAIASLTLLLIGAITNFMKPTMHSDMIVDQKHLNQKLQVNIDIQFPKYPCSMLSLDIQNVLKVHEVNIGNTIHKYNLPAGDMFTEITDRTAKFERIKSDFQAGDKGCRMKGYFEIDRVPGNFHFSCHGYGNILQQFINEGVFRDAHRMIDLSHKINYMYFGKNERDQQFSSLKQFSSQKQIGQAFLGISYTYFLDIVESNYFDVSKQQDFENYLYTVRMNEVILGGAAPLVLFKYQTNPITLLHIVQHQQWHVLFVRIVGIIGGIFTVATIIDGMAHSSIHFLLEKHKLGKLK